MISFLVTIAGMPDLNPYQLKNVKKVKEFILFDIARVLNLTFQPFENLLRNSSVLESDEVHKIVNHPVHIVNESGQFSPSAFIPFCHFGEWLGEKIKEFDVPICNGFNAIILNDRLCYKMDPNRYKDSLSEHELKQGITFYVDTNKDRQTHSSEEEFEIYLDTLGTELNNFLKLFYYLSNI